MPTYVYACKNCGHRFELRQSFSDDALVTCPSCGQDALHKVYNSVGIVFKGSGFYSTDSGSKGTGSQGAGAAKGAETAAATSSSSETSSSTTSTPTDSSPSSSAPAPTPAA
ncbi:FmdB family transcriptional regulator [Brachybacterium huguangmaarense]|uniref:FmdB family transcriptional regulator n=1 Tax=Brachybacterium huguangmaarense TaxID=1652028 RepID=A0ABY6G1V1_9MICO|nr:FmdB family zinc ribbon protein [Brachybacterium huguangmaarense]UYG16639.1 FmdB family transcriptional regulator [Brachybacterium huguangmaarense]